LTPPLSLTLVLLEEKAEAEAVQQALHDAVNWSKAGTEAVEQAKERGEKKKFQKKQKAFPAPPRPP
jgi:hypothetical protein